MENSSLNNDKRNIYLVVIGVVILALVLIGGFGFYQNRENQRKNDEKIAEDKKKSDEKAKEDSQKSMTTDSNTISTAEVPSLEQLQGKYTGKSASLLTNALVFPVSEINIDNKNGFTFNASGLDLSLLGLEQLKVNGSFPKVSATVSGEVSAAADNKTFNFKMSNLAIDFLVNGKSVDAISKAKLLEALSKLSLAIPEVTPQKTITLNTTVVYSSSSIKIQSTKASPLVVNFDGTKV